MMYLQQFWVFCVKSYIKLGLFFYYKKIKVNKIETVPKNEAVLFLGNHQNALLDALLIATTSGRTVYFLTRASVFKKPMVAKLLKSINMIPVYRVRDGWHTIKENKSSFSQTANLLHDKKTVGLFPEGNHNLKRSIRTLSKGFTRVIFETLDHFSGTKISIIPIGLNYQKPTTFPDSVAVNYGNIIDVSTFSTLPKNEAVIALKQEVSNSLQQLSTHIPTDSYDTTINQLKRANADFLYPKSINSFIASGFTSEVKTKTTSSNGFISILKIITEILLFAPLLLWRKVILPKIKEPEFIDTFRFAISITLIPLWLLVLFGALCYAFGIVLSSSILFSALMLLLLRVKA